MSLSRLYVPVEPLSDEHWARLARGLFDRLDEPAFLVAPSGHPGARRGGRVTLLRLLAALAAATLGSLSVVRVWYAKTADSGLESRLEVVTAEGASRFTVGESSLTMAPWSRVRVSGDDDHGVVVVLEQGAVNCEVAPRRGRPAFLVDTGDVEVRVMGTRFSVARAAAGSCVEVDRGAVEVVSRGSSTVIHDGGHWPALGGVPAGPCARPRAAAK